MRLPHCNRVAPDGHLYRSPMRGLFFGNRGCLHRADGEPTPRAVAGRAWTSRRWIVCLTAFRGRRRPYNPPGRYTGLYFLDEATAFAAGHRPCAECRRAAYNGLRAAAGLADLGADALDARLHAERIDGGGRRRGHPVSWSDLPDGVVTRAADGGFSLLWAEGIRPWSTDGWGPPRPRPTSGMADVITPPTLLTALRAGYAVVAHPSAMAQFAPPPP